MNPKAPFPTRPRRIGIVGGGSAGYLVALALRAARPDLEVTLIRSDRIPIIGVGESTTPLLPHLLHGLLAIDPAAFHSAVAPTWKLGVRFEWGKPEPGYHFNYAFGPGQLSDAQAWDGHLRHYNLASMLMDAGRVPVAESPPGGKLLGESARIGYHIDNARFAGFLEILAADRGVHAVTTTIEEVVTSAEGVSVLRCEDGVDRSFDLYVDCSGFRALLIGEALGVPFESFEPSLFCDAALVATVPHGGSFGPYTTARTMDSGWLWKIPQRDADHIGYVHATAFITPDAARDEMKRHYPQMSEPRLVAFRPGRRQQFVAGNVIAIGNAYGFVEPLEATSLHMVVVQIGRLLDLLKDRTGTVDHNTRMGVNWDYLRWFLAIHYRFNRRLDTPFWLACRNDTDISGLDESLSDFRRHGPLTARPNPPRAEADPLFGPRGLDALLLGQGVVPDVLPQEMSQQQWATLVAARRAAVSSAMAHASALTEASEDPAVLEVLRPGSGSR